jgi:hypothetical protein
MNPDKRDILAILRSELTFLEQGGYGRPHHASWWPTLIFEDSPACPNYNDRSRPHSCSECALLELVPESQRSQPSPCRFIPITVEGETIEDFYHFGTQQELEAALRRWLRVKIGVMEIRRALAKNDLFRTTKDDWLLPLTKGSTRE